LAAIIAWLTATSPAKCTRPAGAAEVLNEVGAAAAATTVVVGHNPTMEHVLVHSVGRLHGLRPGAVAVVDLEAGRLVETWEPAR
jgi:phosphohistidine phosphatase SixA